MPPVLQTPTRESSFVSTRWTVVRQAADSRTPSQHALSALTELCQIYWRPVYVFLRRQGIPQHDAHDLTQGFFADLIDSRAYTRVDPTKGRFRSFLLGTVKHFVAHARGHDRAQKRGSGWRGAPYMMAYGTEVVYFLQFHILDRAVLKVSVTQAVNPFENLLVMAVSGGDSSGQFPLGQPPHLH
jgi:hypothetical protein